MTNHSPTNVS